MQFHTLNFNVNLSFVLVSFQTNIFYKMTIAYINENTKI